MNEVASILADLKTIVTAPDATEEAKLLAPSIAYQVAKSQRLGDLSGAYERISEALMLAPTV